MEHMNFCRQATQTLQLAEKLHTDETVRRECSIALNSMSKAAKFMLPDGGRLLPDPELRGLDREAKLSLPFPVIALEYRANNEKWITLATEREDDIALQLIIAGQEMAWTPTCLVLLSRTDPLISIGPTFTPDTRPLDDECPPEIAKEPAAALLSMLNALGCSNVHIERSEPKKAGKKVKAALPFDAYHVLTIDVPGRAGERGGPTGPHRAPREHLRRGHIRRLAGGRRTWVNATVVASGRGVGVIQKDYAIRCAA
jgi:hypothetical protein